MIYQALYLKNLNLSENQVINATHLSKMFFFFFLLHKKFKKKKKKKKKKTRS
jgi:hypothetical protein